MGVYRGVGTLYACALLVNFKFHKDVVKVLDKLAKSGLYKTRVDVMLSALRSYEPFKRAWEEEIRSKHV